MSWLAAGYLGYWFAQPYLRGIFWWAWYDGDLSPAGKPAEQVLSKWYQRLAEAGN
ncbi:MAG: hypothetical protein L0387_10850 [Acidobacteria bacterium]|nr:hypothetical protein [Acidobacteriota bacterium]